MTKLENSKIKSLSIISIFVGVIYFGTSVTDFDILKSMNNQKWMLEQFAINYKAMMIACSEDVLDTGESQFYLDTFDEVREFCVIKSADQCDDE